MNKNYLLETSIVIANLKELPESRMLDRIRGKKFSSVICLGELYEGIFLVKKEDQGKIKKGIDEFFKSLNGVLSITEKAARIFGEVRALLRKKGEIVEDLDILIAATCLAENLTLVTLKHRHFQRIPKLKIYKM